MDIQKPMLVTWNDITSFDGAWMSIEEALEYEPSPIQTLGWIIEDNDEYIVMIGSISVGEEDKVCGSVCAIPKTVVVSVSPLGTQNV